MIIDYRSRITAGILAGGKASRMKGIDKGLLELHGKPLISYAINLIQPQASKIIINTNSDHTKYRDFGYPVIGDNDRDYEGPLAGIATCMAVTKTDLLACIPCDSPIFPDDLVSRLYEDLCKNNADICAVYDGTHIQPVFSLIKTTLLGSLNDFLANGERKVDKWYAKHNLVQSDFSDKRHLFININYKDDLIQAEEHLFKST